jgi:phenylalanine-4-hydroxylase
MKNQSASARVDVPTAEDTPYELFEHRVAQTHTAYTAEAHAVWREVLARNEKLAERYGHCMHPAYLTGLAALELPSRVPCVEEINERLSPTGWKTICVDGYIPTSEYVGLMARSIFPISRGIRRAEHVDYAPTPDLVHDVLGHLPMLFLPEHRDFLKRLASVMARAVPNALDAELYSANRHMSVLKNDSSSAPDLVREAEQRVVRVHEELQTNASELTLLTRFYLWTVEFGLLGDQQKFSVYGAALLSSPAEFRAVCDNAAPILPCTLDVIDKDISFSDLQRQYFVARDFAHLNEVLSSYERNMEYHNAPPRMSDVREIVGKGDRSRHA